MAKPQRGAFGQLLQHYRLAAGLSQEELAERAALSKRGISDLERGVRRAPYPATVRRLAAALDLTDHERVQLVDVAHAGSTQVTAAPRSGHEPAWRGAL